MNFISNLVESLFFRSDSMRYWSASLYGLESIKGKAKNLSDPTKPEISFEIQLRPEDKGILGYGVIYTWTAKDADSKLAISWLLGRRDYEYA